MTTTFPRWLALWLLLVIAAPAGLEEGDAVLFHVTVEKVVSGGILARVAEAREMVTVGRDVFIPAAAGESVFLRTKAGTAGTFHDGQRFAAKLRLAPGKWTGEGRTLRIFRKAE